MNLASIIVTSASGVVVLSGIAHLAKKAFDWCRRLGKAMEAVDERSKQLEKNGGTSMLDQINAMTAKMAAQDAVLADQSAKMAEQSAVIAELQRRPAIRLRRW